MRTFLLLLCLLLLSCKTVSGYGNNATTEQFAKSAGLKPIKSSTENQIRVWVTVLNSVRGTYVTNNDYEEFNNLKSKRLKQVPINELKSNIDLIKHLPELAKHSEFTYICEPDIHGGTFYTIEGIYNGKVFSTVASWSSSCTSPGYDAINNFLRDAGYQK